jgi:hypothetical protein
MFDAGGIYVTDDLRVLDHQGTEIGWLTEHPKHPIGLEHLNAHRSRWGY